MNMRHGHSGRRWVLSALLCVAASLSIGCGNDGGSSGTYWTADWFGSANSGDLSSSSIDLLLVQSGSEVLGTLRVSSFSSGAPCLGTGSVSATASGNDLIGVGTVDGVAFSFTLRGGTLENGDKVAVGTYECGVDRGTVELEAVF